MGERDQIEQPLKVIGRYALHSKLAAGGMATVHLGRLMGPAGFSRTVAIKRLHPQFAKDPEFVAMFLDEARLAARIQHPNVVATLDVVARDEELFLVMDYVRGESFSRLLRASRKRRIPIDPRVIVSIISGMLHGLHAAHEAKDEQGRPLSIVHRDVSPQNVIVGTDGVPRVLDFGVAKAAARVQITRDGQMKGKLCYMSPEQLRGAGVDRRSDVFAAGIVLWEALTGRRLFDAEEAGQVLEMILQHPVPPPSSLCPDVPKVLDLMCERALARDPDERYQSARELAVDLEEAAALAPPREVGEWVEQVAGPLLSAREEMVAEIESLSAVSDVTSDSDSAPALMRALDERISRLPGAPGAAAEWDEAPTSVIELSESRPADPSTRVQVPRPARPVERPAPAPIQPDDFENEETTVYDPTIEDYVTEATPVSAPAEEPRAPRASASAAEAAPAGQSDAPRHSNTADVTADAEGLVDDAELSEQQMFTDSDAPPQSDRERAQDAAARRVIMRPRLESVATSPALAAAEGGQRWRLLKWGGVGALAVFVGVFLFGRLRSPELAPASSVTEPPAPRAAPVRPPTPPEADPSAPSDLPEELPTEEPSTEDRRPQREAQPDPTPPPRANRKPVVRRARAPSPPRKPKPEPTAPTPSAVAESTEPAETPDSELDLTNPYTGLVKGSSPRAGSTTAPPPSPAPTTKPAPNPKTADCSTPYIVDDRGIRRIRPECL